MWKLQTDIHRANNIQDMVSTDRRKLTKIMHILKRNNQYGYKEGVSETDAVVKVGKYIEQADNKENVLLMGQQKHLIQSTERYSGPRYTRMGYREK